MAEIIGIRFKREGKQYYFDPQGIEVKPGEGVILETSWGIEFGECVRGNSQVPDGDLVAPLRPIIRLATEEDYEIVRKNREREREAFAVCQEKVQAHELEMKLVDVEYSFDGNKILFFFTSEGRVDFRSLVKDLASIFHTRIELRQIGVRDEAKMLGGLGICGRPFCCSSFLRDFQPVSIKMAKTQSLSLNPTKISGTCGRLMCCLKYEQEAYEDLLKSSPKVDSFVETPDGVGDIISVNTLREKVRVRLDNAPDTLKIYHNSEIRVIRNGKGKRPEGYVPPTPEELSKLRRIQEEVIQEAAQNAFGAVSPGLERYILDHTPPAPEKEPVREPNRHRGSGQQSQGGGDKGDKKQGTRGGGQNRGGRGRPQQGASDGRRDGKKGEKPPVKEGAESKAPKKDQNPGQAPGGDKGPRRQKKASGQAAMEKALPKEKTAPTGNGAGEKKSTKPYWRKRPQRKGKKPKEGSSE